MFWMLGIIICIDSVILWLALVPPVPYFCMGKCFINHLQLLFIQAHRPVFLPSWRRRMLWQTLYLYCMRWTITGIQIYWRSHSFLHPGPRSSRANCTKISQGLSMSNTSRLERSCSPTTTPPSGFPRPTRPWPWPLPRPRHPAAVAAAALLEGAAAPA